MLLFTYQSIDSVGERDIPVMDFYWVIGLQEILCARSLGNLKNRKHSFNLFFLKGSPPFFFFFFFSDMQEGELFLYMQTGSSRQGVGTVHASSNFAASHLPWQPI